MLKHSIFAVLCMTVLSSFAAQLSGLKGEYRNGQVFLQWQEKDLTAEHRLSVWSSDTPISADNLPKAVKVASYLNPGSSTDWWLDASNFVTKRSKKAKGEEIFAGKVADVGAKKNNAKGFVITENGKPVAPNGGLHVHTPKAGLTGKRYFAVALHKGFTDAVLEMTSTAAPIEVGAGKVNAIRFKGNVNIKQTKGKPMIISLHGRGGGVGVDNKGNPVGTHIIFSDSTLAWREGIPFKFSLAHYRGVVYLTLNDRIWVGRKLTRAESGDARDYVNAISTFWLGYNTNIAVSNVKKYQWDNYSEKLIIRIIEWAQETLGVDKNRIYVRGGSMGGTGAVQLITHYPDVFAAGIAYVPIYSYTWAKMAKFPKLQPSIYRMQCSIGRFTQKDKVISPDGKDLLKYGDGALNINRPAVDMPPLYATNGRRDMSIPWVNNPPFYRAANEARQAFTVHWCNGGHALSERKGDIPVLVNEAKLLRFRKDRSFPAFSNSSDNKKYGNGDPDDGDLRGWINRGMDYLDNIVDTPARFEMSLIAKHPDMKYPVKCDVTFRRRQKFVFKPGTRINAVANGKTYQTTIDKDGLLTIKNFVFTNGNPVKVVCTPAK